MAYRSGTYVAFDGLDEADPSKSDFKYYATLKGWAANENIDFKMTDSHEKTDAVKDTSKRATLKARIQDRLRNSKNMIVILSEDTRRSGSMLSYEIEQAVDVYEIPLILAYTGYISIKNVDDSKISSFRPDALTERIQNGTAKAIHVPFKKEPILDALNQFSVNDKMPKGSKVRYSDAAYQSWQ